MRVSLTDGRACSSARSRFHQHRAALAAKGENDDKDKAYFVGSLVDCIGVRAMTLLRLAGSEFRTTSLARSASESMTRNWDMRFEFRRPTIVAVCV